jgi:hypothetical protein
MQEPDAQIIEGQIEHSQSHAESLTRRFGHHGCHQFS